ncbi:hypothetical protein [Nonomuraea sp. WAC 01424]|uniref:hypothetical protein n=1 Tax=Nonomuraea sp. WAC 01424 TaxID=2203200 RepID=UPI00163CAF1A|nr:hypothetical protein [Nonomuraea sp. WAC 01424]
MVTAAPALALVGPESVSEQQCLEGGGWVAIGPEGVPFCKGGTFDNVHIQE